MVLKSRERILIVFAVIAVAFWVFWSFYYSRKSEEIKTLRAEIKTLDLQASESRALTTGIEALEAEVLRQEEELKRLSGRTLSGEEFRSFLRHLAKESNSPQMKFISMTPQEEKLPPPEGKTENPYRRVTVQMALLSTYSKLETYLMGIDELPFLINVDSLQVEKDEESQPLLKVTVGLSMYITS